MAAQDPYGLENLLADSANGELDFAQSLALGIDANVNSPQNTSPVASKRTPPSLQTWTPLQRVEDEKDHTMHNPSPGALHALSDNPENLGLMNATITTREIQNFGRQILPHQQDVHHEHESAEGMHTVDAERQWHTNQTARKRKMSPSDGEGQLTDSTSQVNVTPISQLQAPKLQTAHALQVDTDAPPNQHQVRTPHVPLEQVLLRQAQLQANDRKDVLRFTPQTSPLDSLPLGWKNQLLANAIREAYTDAEIRAVQLAQNAAVRIHKRQNGKVVLSNTHLNPARADVAPQRTHAKDIQQPVQTDAVQEPDRKVRRTQGLKFNKESVRRTPRQTRLPASTPLSSAHVMSAQEGHPFSSSGLTSLAVSRGTPLLPQDIYNPSSGELQSKEWELFRHPLPPVPPQKVSRPNRVIHPHSVAINNLELPVVEAINHPGQSDAVKHHKRPVPSKKRKRDLPPPTRRQCVNNQTMNLSLGAGLSHHPVMAQVSHTTAAEAQATSAVDEGMGAPQVSATQMPAVHPSDDITSPRATIVEQIIQMNGLGAPQRAANPHLSVTMNDYSFLMNKYGVKLRFSKNAQASKYCHVCGRSALTTPVTECANLLIGLCQKVICEKCSLLYDPEYGRREGYNKSLCMHCKASCPKGIARCFQYRRNNEKRRTRNLERKRQKK